jgi:hypothetical protein
VPAARREAAKNRALRRRLVKVKWLRIELGGKSL